MRTPYTVSISSLVYKVPVVLFMRSATNLNPLLSHVVAMPLGNFETFVNQSFSVNIPSLFGMDKPQNSLHAPITSFQKGFDILFFTLERAVVPYVSNS